MDSEQYEELCRHFIAEKVELTLDAVKSVSIPNPGRPGLPEYKHQIDLYWESGDEISLYLNIANVKWRKTAKIEQGEVLLLQQVRQNVAAHKAFMITNVGFTAGAVAVAMDKGIALHVVQPSFDATALPRGDRDAIRAKLSEFSSAGFIYSNRVEHRGLDFTTTAQPPGFRPDPTPGSRLVPHETRVLQGPAPQTLGRTENRSIGGGGYRTGSGWGPGRSGGSGTVKK